MSVTIRRPCTQAQSSLGRLVDVELMWGGGARSARLAVGRLFPKCHTGIRQKETVCAARSQELSLHNL